MGDFGYEYDDDEQDERGDGPADLRKAHRAATKELKALKASLAEKDEKIAALSKRVRSIDIVDLLPKGVSPKVAKLIPENVEPTAEAVKAWLDEYGDVFNIKVDETAATADSTSDDDTDDGDGTPQIDPAVAAVLAGFQSASAGGTAVPAGAMGALVSDVEANAKSPEDVLAIFAKHGMETISGY